MDIFFQIGLSLVVGLLIGIERGWSTQPRGDDQRTAGIRTFGLLGLSGGLSALIAQELGALVMAAALIAMTILLVASHIVESRLDQDPGITTITAGLVTFLLGALPIYGYASLAAAGAVLTSILLSLKPLLHGWLKQLEPEDWYATLKLLLISVVLIPILPDQGFGPWQAINPYELWWMVVLIAGISFLGYVAMKVVGRRRGLLLTGILGGLASSTATTLSLARLHRTGASLIGSAAGILFACAMMFPRVLVVITVLNSELAQEVTPAAACMTLVILTGGMVLWRQEVQRPPSELGISNPFRILPAIQFGGLLLLVVLITEAGRHWLGDHGLYLATTLASLADVDAIVLSITRLTGSELDMSVATTAILLAMVGNTVSKTILATIIGGPRLAAHLAIWVIAAIAIGLGLNAYLP